MVYCYDTQVVSFEMVFPTVKWYFGLLVVFLRLCFDYINLKLYYTVCRLRLFQGKWTRSQFIMLLSVSMLKTFCESKIFMLRAFKIKIPVLETVNFWKMIKFMKISANYKKYFLFSDVIVLNVRFVHTR